MKVTPTQGPVITQGVNSQASTDARARAIAKLSPAAEIPVNQNAIAPEDLSALQPPSQSPQTPDAPSEPTPEPKPPETESSQFVALARRERALRAKAQQQEQAFKAREEALAKREAELQGSKPDTSQYIHRDRIKANALAVLNEEGITYEQLTQQEIDRGQVPQAVQDRLALLESRIAKQDEELANSRKQAQEQQGEAYRAAKQQITQDVTHIVKTNPDFETIKATNSIKDVVELIEETFREEGRIMDVEEAALEVENHLLEEIDKLTELEKIKKRREARIATSQSPNTQSPTPKQPQPMKTLTNATSSSRQLSARERAVMAFKGELGKE